MLAAVVAAVGASAVVVARDVLVPVGDATTPGADPEFAELDYRARIGPAFFSASDELSQTALEIENGTATSSARAERYRAEVIPAARDLLDRARAFSSGSPEVDAVHARCVAALELAATGYEERAAGHEGERVDLLSRGSRTSSSTSTSGRRGGRPWTGSADRRTAERMEDRDRAGRTGRAAGRRTGMAATSGEAEDGVHRQFGNRLEGCRITRNT